MSWRTVVITKTSKPDYSMGHLVVIDNDFYIDTYVQCCLSAINREST